jgi:hypothetical protein
MRSNLVVTALLALGLGNNALAQHVPPGTKIRLTTPESYAGWHVGNLTGMTRDSVRIAYATGDSATIALADIGLMDSSRGERTPIWAALSGVVLTPAGATVGVLGGLLASIAESRELDTYVERGLWVGAATGFAAGRVIAGTVKREDWDPIMLPARGGPVASASGSAASMAPSYRPRMRLKLRVDGNKVIGDLIDVQGDSVVLTNNSAPTTYATARVTDVYVSRGKSAWAGAKFGGLVGAGVGLAAGVAEAMRPNDDANATTDPNCDTGESTCRLESDVSTVAGSVIGYGLLGGLVGAIVRREQWVRSSLPSPARDREPARLLFAPARGGVRIGVHATF